MTIAVGTQFDCSQRELIVDIAARIYKIHGGNIAGRDIMYLFNSQHPTEIARLQAAEDIYEIFMGDSPDYDDEER